jgi:hypothetical protein
MKYVNVIFATTLAVGLGFGFAKDASSGSSTKKTEATGAPATTGVGGSSMGSMGKPGSDPAEKLDMDMRKLWSDHAFWLRDVIVATLANQPDQKAATDRLMKNQEDIGDAMSAYYGKSAGEQLTKLLKEHETIGAEVVMAARDGKKTAQQDADKRWHQNAQQVADLLSKWNPNWSKSSLTDMMNKHLSTTTDYVTARVDKKWEQDVKAFDSAYEHTLDMADALSEGIIKQFPDKFSQKVGKR